MPTPKQTAKPSPNRSPLYVEKAFVFELPEEIETLCVQLMQAGIGNPQLCDVLRKRAAIKPGETLHESLLTTLRTKAFPQVNTRRRPALSAEAYHVGMLGLSRMVVGFVRLMDACFDALLDSDGKLKPVADKKLSQLRSLLALSTQRIREIMTPESELISNFLDSELARLQTVTRDKTLSEERKKELIAQFQRNMVGIVQRIADSIREGKPVPSLSDLSPDIQRFFLKKETIPDAATAETTPKPD